MFGFGTTKTTAKQEADKAAVERAMQGCKEQLRKMHDCSPDEAERLSKLLKDRCGNDKTLPYDFKRKVLERARQYECFANMRATDNALHSALRLAADEDMVRRGKMLSEGRRFFSKACGLGADDDFRKAAQRLMDTIMMTGGIQHKGPTRAKPADLSPRNPNRAKS